MAGADFQEIWLLVAAVLHYDRAARVKTASSRRVQGAGDVASKQDAPPFLGGVWNRDG